MSTIGKNYIIHLEERLLQSMKNGDIEELAELLHDDLLFVIPTGQTITKEMDLANYKSGKIRIDNITFREQHINLMNDAALFPL